MKKHIFSASILIVMICLTGCSPEQPNPTTPANTPVNQNTETAESGYRPVFQPGECKFDVPEGFEVECGDLIVPEDRSDPNGNQVSMHVVIFKSRSDDPKPDPLIYLTGGGGGNELDHTINYLDDGMDAILDERDFIMYNQRGAKYSTPYLACPRETAMMTRASSGDLTEEESSAIIIDFYSECRNDLIEQGIDLGMYNTAVNAMDFDDLRIALGYDQVNIYGTSYGSGLVLAILRDYSEHIRSAIIDSVYPPQGWFYSEYGTNAYNAFQRVFDACEADAFCSEAYPDLEEVMLQAAAELNENPRTFWSGMNDSPEYTYDGDDFINVLYMYPYITAPGMLPRAVYQASSGNFSLIDNFIPYVLGTIPSDTISAGVQWSILCREEASPEALDLMYALNQELPAAFASAFDYSIYFEICASWDVPQAEDWESSPVYSDVPTLVLSGEVDPITPVEWAQLAAKTLDNHYLFIFPGWGHGVMRSNNCGLEIGLQFLEDPFTEPDSTCIEALPGIVFD